MTVTTTLLTFGAGALQFPAAPGPSGLTHRVSAEPLRANTHACYIGSSTVANDGSGTGVIRELAQPPAATVALDRFDYQDDTGSNRVDPAQFWAHGTTGEKLKLTYITQ